MRDLTNKNVLVIGGAGFIGSHLCDALLNKKVSKVICLDNFFLGRKFNLKNALKNLKFKLYCDDARQNAVLQNIIINEKIDIVFNLATIALNYSFFNPSDAYMVNVQIANNIVELLKNGFFKTLIHVSSSEAFGTALYSPMDEEHPLNPTTPYAAGKLAADLLVESYYKILDLDVSIIRPFNNYGPRQNPFGPLAGIIPNTINRLKKGLKPIINGDGNQTRDFIYVSDTIAALLLAYEKDESRGKIINIGYGKDISINDLVGVICRKMNIKTDYIYNKERISDVKKLCCNISLAKKILFFEPKICFERGIELTIDWYNDNLFKFAEEQYE